MEDSESLDEGFYREDDLAEEDRDEMRIVDLLPTSVEVLKLVTPNPTNCSRKIFRGFVDESEQALPHLKTIEWEGNHGCPLDDKTNEELKGLGIVLKSSGQIV